MHSSRSFGNVTNLSICVPCGSWHERHVMVSLVRGSFTPGPIGWERDAWSLWHAPQTFIESSGKRTAWSEAWAEWQAGQRPSAAFAGWNALDRANFSSILVWHPRHIPRSSPARSPLMSEAWGVWQGVAGAP